MLASVAAWREREAQRRDRPASWVVPDRTLVEIARRRPATGRPSRASAACPTASGAPTPTPCSRRSARARPLRRWPSPSAPPPEVQQRLDVLGPLGAVLVTARAAAVDLAPSLVATRDEIASFLVAAIARRDLDGQPLATGWRRELVGDAPDRARRGAARAGGRRRGGPT